MAGDEWVRIYDLRHDGDHVAAVQKATLSTTDFGLVPEHGLFGSDEWWQAVDSGEIPTHVSEGRISRVFMSGHNDYPEFTVGGRSWTRQTSETTGGTLSRRAKAELFRVGSYARVLYVMQKSKRPDWGTHECAIEIAVRSEKLGERDGTK